MFQNEDPSLSSSKTSITLPGITAFLHQMDELLNQEQLSKKPQALSGVIAISMTPVTNAMELLLLGSRPLNPKDTNAHTKLLANQEEAFRYVEMIFGLILGIRAFQTHR